MIIMDGQFRYKLRGYIMLYFIMIYVGILDVDFRGYIGCFDNGICGQAINAYFSGYCILLLYLKIWRNF